MNISRPRHFWAILLLVTAATAFYLSGPAGASIYQEVGGTVVIETEEPFSVAAGTNGAGFSIQHSGASNFRGDGFMQILPDAGAGGGTPFAGTGPVATYQAYFGSAGTYRLWHRGNGPDGGGDSFYVRAFKDTPGDYYLVTPSQPTSDFNGRWNDDGRLNSTGFSVPISNIDIPITQSGLHTIQIAQREDGTRVDSLLLDRTGTFAGTDPGPAASSPPAGLVYRESGGQVVIEAEHFKTRSAGASDTYTVETDGSVGDPRGGLFMRSGPNNLGGNTSGDVFANGPTLGYDVLIETPGSYRAWVRLADNPTGDPKGNDDSVWVRMYKSSPGASYLVSQNLGGVWDWQNSGFFNVDRTGVWHFDIAMREDGTDIDAIILDSTGTFTGSTLLGPPESAFAVIPEPSTLLVWSLLTGLAIGLRRRRR